MLDRTRPKAVAESRLHSSSVKVHGAPSPRWNPWQRGRREHPRAGNPRSLPIWRAQVKSSEPPDLDGELSALVPGEKSGVGLPCRDSGKHPLAASRAFRHRPVVVDLRAGLAAVDREGQRNQAVGPTRGTKDLQNDRMVPCPPTFHVSVREPFADRDRPCSQRLSHTTVGGMPRCGQTAHGAYGTVAALCWYVLPAAPIAWSRLSCPEYWPDAGTEVVFRRPMARCSRCSQIVVANVIARQRLPKST